MFLRSIVLSLVLSATLARAGEIVGTWPQFHGPGGLGIASDEKTYPAELNTSKNLLWNMEVPPGHSSPCIWGDRIFITAQSGKSLETICIDRGSGGIKWRKAVEPGKMETISSSNSNASPTPACDGTRVYVYFGSVGLLAYDFDGNELWRKVLPMPDITHGSASSPVTAGELVIINCDQKNEPYLLAVNRSNGEQVWKTARQATRNMYSWATPVLWKRGQETELVIVGREKLIGYDPKDGSELWRIIGLPIETAPTPVYTDQMLYAAATVPFTGDPVNPIELPDYKELLENYDSNGDGRLVQDEIPDDLALVYRLGTLGFSGIKKAFPIFDADKDGALSEEEWGQASANAAKMPVSRKDIFLAVRGGGRGNITESHVRWSTSEGVGQVASPLVYRGRVYLVKHGGNVTCFNAETGERVYGGKLGQRAYYFASPVAADGKIYFCSYTGAVFVVQAGDKFKIISQLKTKERIRATPALVDGNVYLRTEKHLMAFGDS